LDGFGRVVYQNWFNTLTGAQVEGDQYGYDNDSDVLYDNVVGQGSTAAKYSQLYHASSTASGDDNSGYDPLGRETTFIQGTLSASGNNTSSDASLDTVTNANINTAAGSDQTFTLDALGNRTSSDTGAGTGTSTAPTLAATTATYNSQNETSETFNSCCYCFFPTYDNDGNMTADGTGDTYTYDAWGDMMSGSDSSSCGCACTTTTAGFDYDANGRQIEQNDATSTNCSCGCSCGVDTYAFRDADEYYSDQAQVVEDDGSYASCCCTYNYSCGCNFSASCTYGCATDNYSWGLDYVNDLVLRDSSGTVGTWTDVNGTITSPTPTSLTPQRIYAEHDANFDIKTLTNTSGTVLEHIVYDPYGNATLLNSSYGGGAGVFGSDSYHWIYGFQGGRYDPGSGLYHFGARNYSSATGRWMEQDPAGYINGPNVYQTEMGDPATILDPLGLAAVTAKAEVYSGLAYDYRQHFQHGQIEKGIGGDGWNATWNPDWGLSIVVNADAEGDNIRLTEAPSLQVSVGKLSDKVGQGVVSHEFYKVWGKPALSANLSEDKLPGHCVRAIQILGTFGITEDRKAGKAIADVAADLLPGEGAAAKTAQVVGKAILDQWLEAPPQVVTVHYSVILAADGERSFGIYGLPPARLIQQTNDGSPADEQIDERWLYGTWIHSDIPTNTATSYLDGTQWEAWDSAK
jgi:RHS repeat-associated protein